MAFARDLVRDTTGRQHGRGPCSARDRVPRSRRCADVDADRTATRDPVCAPAEVDDRPNNDGVRPDRDLRAPGLDRAGLLVHLRLQARLDADHRLLQCDQPDRELRRAGAVGVPPDLALGDVRAALRGALRTDDPREAFRYSGMALSRHIDCFIDQG